MFHTPKRLFVGRPLRSDRIGETLLPKWLALPVFCSDPLSSVAYATEQILLVLGLGGLGMLYLTPWLGLAVVVLLVIVIASYRQTCHAYPNGGGAYRSAGRTSASGPAWSRRVRCWSTTSSPSPSRWSPVWPRSPPRCPRWRPTPSSSRWASSRC
jgi:hypothetical protein